jgi:TatD DNase family protein
MKFWDFHTHQRNKDHSIYNWDGTESIPTGQFSLGFHPWSLDVNWKQRFSEFENFAQENPSVLAIGECGFDRIKGPITEIQKEAFAAQAILAYNLGIPVILHCVKGYDLFLEFLKKEKRIPSIIWHGWNLRPDLGRALIPFPVNFSFGKHILNADSNAAQWLQECPKDRFFFETDDSEVEISQIYQTASLILGRPVRDLLDQVLENWNRIASRKIK